MILKDAWVLLFSPLIIIIIYLVKRRDNFSSIKFSSVDLVTPSRPTLRLFLAKNTVLFRAAALSLFLLALARPQIPLDETKISAEGIDILLAIDSSGSMLAEDFEFGGKRRNRLEVVKRVVEDFIRQRKNDRIGMIAFAARAYTVCPLTLDYDWLIRNLERVEIGAIEDGTAVGSAITSSLNRLKDSEAKSKIVILLTDGINNMGSISPAMAAEAAQALGIKIYTIGAGTKGLAPYPIKGLWGETIYNDINIEIDEDTLKEIAGKTGGQYFRATDTESLKEIYDQINKMEKTPVEELGFQEFEELFSKFLKAALLILALEIFLTNTLLRKLP
ncbi:MAG: VWA domain-containing protein [Candidatus Omnitrophica bacterium]|nr:VWA domain-containing protein [Candidatus Omnitrophota bacterium]